MTRGQILTEDAFILHCRNYRDTSKIIQALTRSSGIISLIAKGARSQKKGAVAPIQPMQLLRLSWSSRGSLGVLRNAEITKSYPHIQGNKLISTFYINEILMKLFEINDPEEQLFYSYLAYMEGLAETTWIQALRLMEMKVLEILGYYPDFLIDNLNQAISKNKNYIFDPDSGFVKTQDKIRKGIIFSGESILSIGEGILIAEEAQALCKKIFRLYLDNYLIGSKVNTRGVMSDILKFDLGSGYK